MQKDRRRVFSVILALGHSKQPLFMHKTLLFQGRNASDFICWVTRMPQNLGAVGCLGQLAMPCTGTTHISLTVLQANHIQPAPPWPPGATWCAFSGQRDTGCSTSKKDPSSPKVLELRTCCQYCLGLGCKFSFMALPL